MHDDDQKKVEGGEGLGPEPSENKKRPLRSRAARSRDSISMLAFMLHEGLRADNALPNTRAKLLAWAGMYGKDVK